MLSSPAEDPSLFIKARQGSGEALGAVFERYAGRLHALIRLRLGPGLPRQTGASRAAPRARRRV